MSASKHLSSVDAAVRICCLAQHAPFQCHYLGSSKLMPLPRVYKPSKIEVSIRRARWVSGQMRTPSCNTGTGVEWGEGAVGERVVIWPCTTTQISFGAGRRPTEEKATISDPDGWFLRTLNPADTRAPQLQQNGVKGYREDVTTCC